MIFSYIKTLILNQRINKFHLNSLIISHQLIELDLKIVLRDTVIALKIYYNESSNYNEKYVIND